MAPTRPREQRRAPVERRENFVEGGDSVNVRAFLGLEQSNEGHGAATPTEETQQPLQDLVTASTPATSSQRDIRRLQAQQGNRQKVTKNGAVAKAPRPARQRLQLRQYVQQLYNDAVQKASHLGSSIELAIELLGQALVSAKDVLYVEDTSGDMPVPGSYPVEPVQATREVSESAEVSLSMVQDGHDTAAPSTVDPIPELSPPVVQNTHATASDTINSTPSSRKLSPKDRMAAELFMETAHKPRITLKSTRQPKTGSLMSRLQSVFGESRVDTLSAFRRRKTDRYGRPLDRWGRTPDQIAADMNRMFERQDMLDIEKKARLDCSQLKPLGFPWVDTLQDVGDINRTKLDVLEMHELPPDRLEICSHFVQSFSSFYTATGAMVFLSGRDSNGKREMELAVRAEYKTTTVFSWLVLALWSDASSSWTKVTRRHQDGSLIHTLDPAEYPKPPVLSDEEEVKSAAGDSDNDDIPEDDYLSDDYGYAARPFTPAARPPSKDDAKMTDQGSKRAQRRPAKAASTNAQTDSVMSDDNTRNPASDQPATNTAAFVPTATQSTTLTIQGRPKARMRGQKMSAGPGSAANTQASAPAFAPPQPINSSASHAVANAATQSQNQNPASASLVATAVTPQVTSGQHGANNASGSAQTTSAQSGNPGNDMDQMLNKLQGFNAH